MTHTRTSLTAAVCAAAVVLALSACASSKDNDDATTPPADSDQSTSADSGQAADNHATECIPAEVPTGTAEEILEAAGVSTPVTLNLQYSPEHYGESSADEYAAVKAQLEESGLFTVNLQSTEWATYSEERTSDVYPVYQLGWFPDFPDPDNYLTPFFDANTFLANHFEDKCVIDLLDQERTETDPAAREGLLNDLQTELATKLSTIPLLQGQQVAVTGTDVTGVENTLDASFQFRFATLQAGGDPSGPVSVGTTDIVTALDPAGSYDNASYLVELNVYPFVLGFPQQDPVPTPDLAESCDFSDDGAAYTCTIKSGLKWANGNDLTSSDVKFSFDRQIAINDPEGPASLLANLASVDAPDDTTVVFNLTSPNDVTFAQVLASPAGPIVDEEVFAADALTPDQDIIAGKAFGGAYVIESYLESELIEYSVNPEYAGVQGTPANGGVTVTYYAEPTNLKLAIEQGDIDVAWRSLTPTDLDSLSANDAVKVIYGPGGEIRYIVWNLNTQPGDTYEQKLAIRQAAAKLIDREELSQQVYRGLYTPLCGYIPDGQAGAGSAVCDAYNTNPAQ
jgi:ABC-type transport system substrate-binding protein